MKEKKFPAWGIVLIVLGVIVAVYMGFALYFTSHFQFCTQVNGVDISGKSLNSATTVLKNRVDDYVLEVKGREGVAEQISGGDIDLQYENAEKLQEVLDKQEPFLWSFSLFGDGQTQTELFVTYDSEKLETVISDMNMLKKKNQKTPVSAKPIYKENQFEIQSEDYGYKLDKKLVHDAIKKAVQSLEVQVDLDESGCYVEPTYYADSKQVIEANELANSYLKSQITYTIDDDRIVVNYEDIAKWIAINGKMKVTLDEERIESYLKELDKEYNTIGIVREITTPTGKEASVSGGTYGREIDISAECKQLKEDIKAGERVVREPIYTQDINTGDGPIWGTTYVEVDITEQHMWYIKEGEVVFESDVVTGKPNPERKTPQGVYFILEKMRDKVLRGRPLPNGKPSYLTPVSYWMRVTWTGIGFHDATWQAKFGGKRYKQGYGSHGCINMPLKKASELYEMLEKGCPVIIHY